MNITYHHPAISFPILLLTSIVASAACAEDELAKQIQPLFSEYCLSCHAGAEAEAGLDLTRLNSDLSDVETARRWILLHDRLAKGEMPPADSDQPPPDLRQQTVKRLSAAIIQAEQKRNDVVLRRLNRVEYENTVRDLFGAYVEVKGILPEDTSWAGFDNVGEGLSVSAEAIQTYLKAADVTLDAVFGPAKEPKRIVHETNLLKQLTFDGKPALESQIGKMFRRTDDGLVIFQSNYCPTNLVNFARLRAPAGTYKGTVRVRAIQSDKPVTLRIYGGDTIVGRREKHLVGYWDIPPGEWTTIEFTDRLVEDGGTYQPKCYNTRDTRKDADTYPEPGLEIGDITLEGPLEAWPPESRQRLFQGIDPEQAVLADAGKILASILPRAFRRDVDEAEVKPFLALIEAAIHEGRSFEDSLRVGLKAILCSPQFLFLMEPGRERVSDFALASRLSYFLWSTMPDAELLALARENKLSNPDVLRAQVERMLADPKAAQFTKNFAGQWLDLREIDFTEPDANLFPEFDELLRLSMVKETELFFAHVLENDLSLMNFVDSEFTFLNERLAKHYEIPGVEGQEFRKVTLPPEHVRGGVLTQASLLKVTANGTNTSPVIRGAWVLENILGQPSPPPPDNIPAVEPDIRGTTTLREQLAAHRNVEACQTCHDRIDPPGFALENFDPIGGWRETYRTLSDNGPRPEVRQAPFTYAWVRYRLGAPVDATGSTRDGFEFHDIRQFRDWLNRQDHQVATALTSNLLVYATGRTMGFSDRAEIERIVQRAKAHRLGFRTLIHEVVRSSIFQSP